MKTPEQKLVTRNKYFFGLGTVGRDMFYALEANALIYFLSNVLSLPLNIFAACTMVLSVLRVIDAINDPITGLFVDNVNTRWGKYKPCILGGGVISVLCYLVLFGNIGTGKTFVAIFAIAYVIWDISYGVNDIAYWTLLPALTSDQKQRESYGAFARICANIGMYIVMVGWQPVTAAMGNNLQAWFKLAVAVSVLYILFLFFPLFGVKERKNFREAEDKTTLKDMWRALIKNDQLMWTTLSMVLFNVGYITTTSFATYYMQYVYGDINMYAVLAGICGIAQLTALMIFPLVSKRMNRKQIYTLATIMIIIGYIEFFFAENSLIMIGIGAVMIFIGQAFVQLLMLMFLADTVEYGQWKLGRRSESITFSIQPLINKLGGAISTAIVSISVIIAGIKTADSDLAAESIDAAGKTTLKSAMLIIPLILIIVGYIIYRKKYIISEEYYSHILNDLKARGDMNQDAL